MFTWENLDNAVAAYNKLLAKIAALTPGKGDVDPAALEELKARFTKAMDNDLNTSMAVTVLYDVLKAKTTDATKLAALDSFDQVLGLKLTEKAASRARPRRLPPPAASPWSARTAARILRWRPSYWGPGRRQEGQKLRRGRPHPG